MWCSALLYECKKHQNNKFKKFGKSVIYFRRLLEHTYEGELKTSFWDSLGMFFENSYDHTNTYFTWLFLDYTFLRYETVTRKYSLTDLLKTSWKDYTKEVILDTLKTFLEGVWKFTRSFERLVFIFLKFLFERWSSKKFKICPSIISPDILSKACCTSVISEYLTTFHRILLGHFKGKMRKVFSLISMLLCLLLVRWHTTNCLKNVFTEKVEGDMRRKFCCQCDYWKFFRRH